MRSKEIELNQKQIDFLQPEVSEKYIIGGRGSGKTFVLGVDLYMCFNALPKAMFVLANQTYGAVYNTTLSGIESAFQGLGLMEYDPRAGLGHYVIGKKPPFGWYKPYNKKSDYTNLVSFINGFSIEIASLANPDKLRGNNFDGMRVDEAAFNKREVINKVLRPAIRGNTNLPGQKSKRFDHYLHHSKFYYTSAPWSVDGQWLWDMEEEAKVNPESILFLESRTIDNIHILGKKYLDDLKRELSPVEYYIEVENGRLRKLPNGFYPAFSEEKHVVFDTKDYDYNESVRRVWLEEKEDKFYQSGLAILLSFDFNAKFTSCIVCQEIELPHSREFRILENLFIKPGESHLSMIDALVDKFCEAYKYHKYKRIEVYGDRNGNNKNPGNTRTFYQQIDERLKANGWSVIVRVQGLDPDHHLKYQLLNDILGEKNLRAPIVRVNGNKCKSLIISITNSPILPDFKKDKSSELRSGDQAFATHLSDCFDLIVYRRYENLTGSLSDLKLIDF